jgi:hypothetical protein
VTRLRAVRAFAWDMPRPHPLVMVNMDLRAPEVGTDLSLEEETVRVCVSIRVRVRRRPRAKIRSEVG